MKTVITACALAIVMATMSAAGSFAQQRDRRPDGPAPDSPQDGPSVGKLPIVAALDENGDGEISPAEIEKATEALKGLDEDGDGKLSEEEIRPRPAPRGEGPDGPPPAPDRERMRGPDRPPGGGRDPAQFIDRLMQADANGDGKISKEEAPERLAANFDAADQNGDGFWDKSDLSEIAARFGGRRGGDRGQGPPPGGPGGMGGSPEEFVDRLFRLDADGDGKLTREELSQMGNYQDPRGRGDRPEGNDDSRPRRPQRPNGGN
jgi:collagen type III alpha